jgi:hypothetical protein
MDDDTLNSALENANSLLSTEDDIKQQKIPTSTKIQTLFAKEKAKLQAEHVRRVIDIAKKKALKKSNELRGTAFAISIAISFVAIAYCAIVYFTRGKTALCARAGESEIAVRLTYRSISASGDSVDDESKQEARSVLSCCAATFVAMSLFNAIMSVGCIVGNGTPSKKYLVAMLCVQTISALYLLVSFRSHGVWHRLLCMLLHVASIMFISVMLGAAQK